MALSLRKVYRHQVITAKGRRVGRVSDVLFSPQGTRVVGMVVMRPRLLMLLDRRDRYLALDSVRIADGQVHVAGGRGSWDKAAASRLGFSWDGTVVWQGMPVRTVSGTALGTVRDGLFDPSTGDLLAVGLTSGVAADAAVGVRDVPVALVQGFDGTAVVLADEAALGETSGGAAAAAGKGMAIAKDTAGNAVKTATRYGKAAAKVASQSATGKKAMGWLKSMKDEVVDMMGEPDDT
jgi:sporulation protein YlmC with PRC-barrel domain